MTTQSLRQQPGCTSSARTEAGADAPYRADAATPQNAGKPAQAFGKQTSTVRGIPSQATKHLRNIDLLILAVGTFTLGVDGFVLSGLLPQVAASLRVSVSTAGQLTTLFALAYAVCSPVISTLTGSWDRRALLTAGMAVFIIGTILQAAGPTLLVVACGRVIAAVGAAAYQANAYNTAGLGSADTQRARSLAVVAGGSSLALVAGLPFGILVGQFWGWRNALWILVALAAISGITLWLLPAVHAPRTSLHDRVRALSDPRVLSILVGTVTVLTPPFLIIAYLPAILSTSGGLIVAAMLAYGSGQFLGTTAVPRLIRWRGAHFALVLGASGVTVSSAMLAASRTNGAVAVLAMIALGLSISMAIVPQQHRLFALVPEMAPVSMGLNGSAIYIASALGSALGGGVLATAEASALAPAAMIVGLLAITLASAVRPERRAQRIIPQPSSDNDV